ncbi:MFS transporter [Vigna unguiculata]|uniref:MFS transporter n=1 Tax=Vigna unguiculata TaxID=3917 RepID=A0A4D6MFD6_VIGUN|nr:MFS transporter [Vigna unguiculata]
MLLIVTGMSLRGKDVDISHEAAEILDYIETFQSLPKTNLLDLFQSKYVRSLVIGVGLMACQQSVGINGIGFYTAETFVAAGFSSGKAGTIAYACMQVPFTILGEILMDRVSKLGKDEKLSVKSTFYAMISFSTGFQVVDEQIPNSRSPSTATIFNGGETFDGGEIFDGGTTFDGGEATETGSVLVVVESRWRKKKKCVWTDRDRRQSKNHSSVHWM